MLFILNNKYEAIGVLDESLENGCPFFNDIHHARLENGYNTFIFSVPSNHEKAGLILPESYIVYTNDKDGHELFRVKRVTEQHGDTMTKTISCEPASTHDLITKRIRPTSFIGENAKNIIISLLVGSGWEIGTFEYNGIETISFDDYPTALDAIHRVIAQFDLEIEFKVEFNNVKVERKLINLYKKRGRETNIFFEYERNLVGVVREEHTNQLYTSMVSIGQEGVSIETIVADEEGFEVIGDTLVDTVALQKWTKDGIHREGLYRNTDAQSNYELYKLTLAELKKYNKPQFFYTVQVAMTEQLIGYDHMKVSIGDQILIKDATFLPEPLYIQARILEKETSLTEPDKGIIVLGEFVEIKVKPIVAVQKLQQKIEASEEQWNQAHERATEAIESANQAYELAQTVEVIAENAQSTADGAMVEVGKSLML